MDLTASTQLATQRYILALVIENCKKLAVQHFIEKTILLFHELLCNPLSRIAVNSENAHKEIREVIFNLIIKMLFQSKKLFSTVPSTVFFISRSSRLEVFMEKGVLGNLTKFTGKRLCQQLY